MGFNMILSAIWETLIPYIGMIIVNFGLAVSILGAHEIYRADFPRNDWTLQALKSATSGSR